MFRGNRLVIHSIFCCKLWLTYRVCCLYNTVAVSNECKISGRLMFGQLLPCAYVCARIQYDDKLQCFSIK